MSRRTQVRWILCGRRRFVVSAMFIVLATPLPVQAALLWDWTYSGAGIAASGTFTTDDAPDSGGYYHITGITGSRNGVAIISLEPTGKAIPGNAGFPVDNLITASGAADQPWRRLRDCGRQLRQSFLCGFFDPAAVLGGLYTAGLDGVQRAADRVRRCDREITAVTRPTGQTGSSA